MIRPDHTAHDWDLNAGLISKFIVLIAVYYWFWYYFLDRKSLVCLRDNQVEQFRKTLES
jgi:hypothetical protein